VILLYPLVLVAVVAYALARRGQAPARRGWPWLALWAAAGALFAFSLLTGLSIGLLVLPFAVGALFAAAHVAPAAEAWGLGAGLGAVLVLVGTAGAGGGGWTVAGVAAAAASLGAYVLLRRSRSAPPAATARPTAKNPQL